MCTNQISYRSRQQCFSLLPFPYRKAVVDERVGEVEVAHEQADGEERPLEVGLVLGEAGVVDRRLVQLLVLGDGAVVVLEAVPDQLEVLGDVVDDRAEARQATGHHRLLVLQDQLDRVLLELRHERLARVLDQRHHQLQRARHAADDLKITLRLIGQKTPI